MGKAAGSQMIGWLNPWRWLLLLGAAVSLVAGYHSWAEHQRDIGRAEVRDIYAKAAAEATRQNLVETQRRAAAQKEIDDDAQAQLARARADAVHAAAAADGLRRQLAAYVRSATVHPAAEPGGAAAGDPIGVLADVLSRADERAGVLAQYADAAHAAGAACEREYDALTGSTRSKLFR